MRPEKPLGGGGHPPPQRARVHSPYLLTCTITKPASPQGIQLHYVEKGDRNKPLLVLVHGFPAFWYCWHYQIKDLAKDYWVVAVDLRGYVC